MSDERLHEDELVSAYLDGEATPAETAEVEASAALLARVEELRAVRDALAEPVVPLSAEQRDDLIGAALGAADAEDAARREARVVPLHRPQRLLLAMAAAVIVLAAVVGTGLIASRGGDDEADTAAPATEAATGMVADAAPAAEEEPMPEMDMAAADEAVAEEPMAEEAPAEEAAMAAEAQIEASTAEAEAMADELARLAVQEAEAEAEAAMAQEAPAATTTTIAAATTTAAAETDDGDDSPTEQVVDLGMLESLESLFEDIGASWSAALEDGAMADSGACAEAVQEEALALSAETVRSFVAAVGDEDPITFDAGFARRDDGTAVIVYAAPPDCEIGVHELPRSESE